MIPEQRLITWSHQGAVTTSVATYNSIKNAIETYNLPTNVEYDIYPQGSYKNTTNIRGDSDVDLVVQLNSTFHRDISKLSPQETYLYNSANHNATYTYQDFKNDIFASLQKYFGTQKVKIGNKSLKVLGDTGRLFADVIICCQYRIYQYFRSLYDQGYTEGIIFWTVKERRSIINFPKLHYDNGVNKNSQNRTNGWFKHTVRVFKNARSYLVDSSVIDKSVAPSYFLECLLYNSPNNNYGNSYQNSFVSNLTWIQNILQDNSYTYLKCQNEQQMLFGNTPEQWSLSKLLETWRALMQLWRNWQ